MSTQIFVNLPVKDLERSKAFFGALGYTFNPDFTDDNAACMVVSENIHVMLLVETFFKTFIREKSISDAKKSTEVLICLSLPSTEAVDDIVGKALAAGGAASKDPKDHGFMYEHGFEDPDGHLWEFVHMRDQPPTA
jgi:predicted lactoylglutathione lyase